MTSTLPKSQLADARPIWVVRAAKHGDAHSLFLDRGLVALEDPGLGNLTKIKNARDAFYAAYQKLRPNDSRVSISGIGGKFFRFAHEMLEDDVVLYPATDDKCVYVGKITGAYHFDRASRDFPHQLPVKWIGNIPNSSLSQTARHELGAARMLFQIKRHDKEVRRLLEKVPKSSAR